MQNIPTNNFNNDFKDKCIHELFAEQVKSDRNAIAVVFQGQELTYGELDDRANQLAKYLQQLGVKAEVLVGICLERSLDLIIGLLAILKAGGAYLPLDPTYPAERLAYMLADAKVSVLLTKQTILENLPQEFQENTKENPENIIICLDQVCLASADIDQVVVGAENLAYVMYTSGSTGKPKGICILHRGVVRLVKATDYVNFSPDEVFLQLAPYAFDASTFEIWGCLLNGAKLVLCPINQPSLEELGAVVNQYQITTLWLTAGLFQQMVDRQLENLKSLRQLLAGGDVLSVPHVRQVLANLPNCRLINGYGPTENTTFTCCYTVTDLEPSANSVPIGRAIANTQVYILDQNQEPVAIGISGELYTGGDGLARGYLNRPELTAEKFIAWTQNGERLYRTGDLARYLADGNIEFLGRIDNQVKVRGFRIELGEIEAVLSQHPAVRSAVVIVREDIPNDQRLVAYVIADRSGSIQNQLRHYLQQRLPAYMLPSAIAILEILPLTPNGKIDRRALPPIPEFDREGIAPRNPTEQILANIWSEVLKVKAIAIHDNFFELGGHSLLATQVISRIRDLWGVEIPMRSLFENPAIAEFALKVTEAQQNQYVALPPILPRSNEKLNQDILSFAQERIWFLDQLEGNSAIYNIPMSLQLEGDLKIGALEQALNAIAQRHAVLRTSFINQDGAPVPVIAPNVKIELPVINLADQSEVESVQAQARYAFDLGRSPLLRCVLFRFGEESHLLLITIHHMIADGWSMGIWAQELSLIYSELVNNDTDSSLADLPIQYTDFAIWQKQWFSAIAPQLNYWQQQLANLPPLLELPSDRPRPAVQTFAGSTEYFEFSAERSQQLHYFSQAQGVTLYMTLMAGFAVLLSRYSYQLDLPIGSVIANRNRREIESLIGFFANTLVLRVDLSGNPKFIDLLKQVRKLALEAYAHQDLPFEKLVESLQPTRSLSYHPLFQVMLIWQNTPQTEWKMSGLTVTEKPVDTGTAKFDLMLSMSEKLTETGQIIQGEWQYNTDLFEAATIRRMIVNFQTLLESAIANPAQTVETLPLLTTDQLQQLLGTSLIQESIPDQCIHQLFESQVEKNPKAIALIYSETQLTYEELNQKANQLAHYLRSQGVKPETLIGVCVERSLAMAIAILGILKSGAAYLPLDPTYPQSRLAYMIADAQIEILITSPKLHELEFHGQLIDLDFSAIADHSTANPQNISSSHNLAYVIYTSGSTGNPKGVMVEHRSLCSYVQALCQRLEIAHTDIYLHTASIAFSSSVRQLFVPLCQGATVAIATQDQRTHPLALFELVKQQRVTIMDIVPSYWRNCNQILDRLEVHNRQELLTNQLRLILSASEPLMSDVPKKWAQEFKHSARLVNMYGQTETTGIILVSDLVIHSDDQVQVVALGAPLRHAQVYILDQHLQPVPMGVRGEIYIGGSGLARGYRHRPDLTDKAFIHSPFGRLYKTGDLARYLNPTKIEFLGRIDHQVKIRGFRIELAEIEAVLNQHPSVQKAIAIALEDRGGDKYLGAFIVLTNLKAKSQNQLRAYLKQKLPDYMIPTMLIELAEFPLTPNGKIDRLALSSLSHPQLEVSFVAPRHPNEEILARIWVEVLKLKTISIDSNFFELGGHSLLAMQVISRIRSVYGLEVPLRYLFEHPTIEQLSDRLNLILWNQSPLNQDDDLEQGEI